MGLPNAITDNVQRNYTKYVAPFIAAVTPPEAKASNPATAPKPGAPSTGEKYRAPAAPRASAATRAATRDAARASEGLRRQQVMGKLDPSKVAVLRPAALPKDNPSADKVTGAMVGVLDEMQYDMKDAMLSGCRPSELTMPGVFDSGNIVCSSWANEWVHEAKKSDAVNKPKVDQLVRRTNAALAGSGVTVTGVTPQHNVSDATGHHWVELDVRYQNAEGKAGTLRLQSQTNSMGTFNNSSRID